MRINETKRTEKLPRQSANQLALIADSAPVFLAHFDREQRYLFVNRPYAERFGLTPAQCIGKRLPEIVGDEAYEAFRQHIETVLSGKPVEFELEVPYSTIGPHFIHCRYNPEFDESGEVVGWVAAITDITQHKLAQEALRASEERYRQIFEQSIDGVFVATRDGQFVDVSPSGCEMFGMTRAEVLSKSFKDLLSPEEHERNPAAIAEFADGQVHYSEWRFRRKDGSVFVGEVSGRQLPDGRLQGIVRDITARKEAEAVLRKSERELADFFDSAAIGLHWVGENGVILRVNQAELDMLGYTREEYLGRHIADFHADRAVIDDILARLTRGERIHDYPARLRCKDGSIRDVLITSSALFEDGRFIHT
ncbi:MAG TPA: PAS domain S-box protein, partial [Pyrinomonadaceae bacterium]|nr:PAS domain S-box protein [Pyrinomonadaceae bacterium]